VVITKSKPMGKVKGAMIHKVVSTEMLPLRERPLNDPDEDTYVNLVKDILKAGPMYFSYNLDLTNSFQRQAKSDPNTPLWMRTDDRFFWNKFISSDLIDFRSGSGNIAGMRMAVGPRSAVDPFILPVICGMLNITKTSIKGNSLTFMLITRRSRHRTGTRYFSRGIDANGNVSNYNETEQSIVLNDNDSPSNGSFSPIDSTFGSGNGGREVQILAYVQTRGSVPVYWAEVNKLKYTPELQVRGVDGAMDAAKRHFDEQIKLYGDNYLVNLVNQKGREARVKNAYEEMVRALQTSTKEEVENDHRSPETVHIVESKSIQQQFDRLHYVYFDFHNETKGLKWHRAQLLLDELHQPLQAQQYFHGVYNLSDRLARVEIRNTQRSVVRTNCMDCLDRTNVVQSMLGRFAINRQLQDLHLLSSNETAQQDTAFEFLFRNVWADNADVVSKMYSGTGALKTDFTRTGKRTRAGALQDLRNSITRYVKNNFADGPRQDAFDLFSGNYQPGASSAAMSGGAFVDRRPIVVQAMPYIMAGCMFFVTVASLTPRMTDAAVWPLRVLILASLGVASYAGRFMLGHGALYVSTMKYDV
jgi:hypothetical protein